jgi:formate hydrogenlyase subunit 3/multisubunit Na+/H+ antiporter MnhD subunit
LESPSPKGSGLVWRIVLTIVIGTGFLSSSLLYIGFYSGEHRLFQQIVVVLVDLIVSVAAISLVWVTWALPKRMLEWRGEERVRIADWRGIASILAGAGFLVVLLLYVGFLTEGLQPFQQIVIVLVALILAGAALSIYSVVYGKRGWRRMMKC